MSLLFVTFSILLYFSNAALIESNNEQISADDIKIVDSPCKLRIGYTVDTPARTYSIRGLKS